MPMAIYSLKIDVIDVVLVSLLLAYKLVSLLLLALLLSLLLTYFTPLSSVSIFDFEQVNVYFDHIVCVILWKQTEAVAQGYSVKKLLGIIQQNL